MDFIYKQVRGARTKSKVILHRLSLNNIIFIDKFILQTVPVCDPYAKINLLSGKGNADRKSRTATAVTVVLGFGRNYITIYSPK